MLGTLPMGEITPINGLDHDLQGLTCIPLRIHCAATPDTDEELSELDRMAIDTFIDELADIAVSIIRRDTRPAEDIE